MTNFTQADLQFWLDAPPTYDELFGQHNVKTPEPETDRSSVATTEAVNELRRQQEEESQRLTYNQSRFLVTDTRASPPEAPHFLNPDQRSWMRDRTEPQSGDSNSRFTGSNTTNTDRQNITSEIHRGNRSDRRGDTSVNRPDTSRLGTGANRAATNHNRSNTNTNWSETTRL